MSYILLQEFDLDVEAVHKLPSPNSVNPKTALTELIKRGYSRILFSHEEVNGLPKRILVGGSTTRDLPADIKKDFNQLTGLSSSYQPGDAYSENPVYLPKSAKKS